MSSSHVLVSAVFLYEFLILKFSVAGSSNEVELMKRWSFSASSATENKLQTEEEQRGQKKGEGKMKGI